MTVPVPVAVIVDGRPVPSSRPAELVAGTVVAPADPYLRFIAATVAVDGEHGTIACSRGGLAVIVRIGHGLARVGAAAVALPIAPFLRDGEPFIPLAPLARGLGAAVQFDVRSKTLFVVLPGAGPVTTPTPYRALPGAASPRPVRFTGAPATPQPTVTWIPQPRRTPIETVPAPSPPPR